MKKNILHNIFSNVLFIVSILAIFAAASVSSARSGGGEGGNEWVVNPAIMYLYSNTTENGTTTSTNHWLLDGSLGYRFGNPFYLGALYSYDSLATTTNGTTTNDVYNSYGPSAGIMNDDVYLIFTYFISSTEQQTVNYYSGGNGYQIAVGYRVDLGNNFTIGPQLDYRSLSFTKVQANSGPVNSSNRTFTTLLPYVSIWYTF